ncbi:MAG: hypothetical protein ACYC5A_10535 [Thermoleophilia bacterium]
MGESARKKRERNFLAIGWQRVYTTSSGSGRGKLLVNQEHFFYNQDDTLGRTEKIKCVACRRGFSGGIFYAAEGKHSQQGIRWMPVLKVG